MAPHRYNTTTLTAVTLSEDLLCVEAWNRWQQLVKLSPIINGSTEADITLEKDLCLGRQRRRMSPVKLSDS